MHRLCAALLMVCLSGAMPRARKPCPGTSATPISRRWPACMRRTTVPTSGSATRSGFDLMRLTPWLQRVHHSDDLDFQEALIEYVASLNDAHDNIAFPTTLFHLAADESRHL